MTSRLICFSIMRRTLTRISITVQAVIALTICTAFPFIVRTARRYGGR